MVRVVEVAVWWTVCVGVWMASLSAWSWHDLVVAVGCGLPCALLATRARRAVGGAWQPPASALQWLLALPVAIVSDAARVLTLPLRRGRPEPGALRTITLSDAGESPMSSGRRALAAMILSATPSSFVIATDPDDGTAVVHALGRPNAVERGVAR